MNIPKIPVPENPVLLDKVIVPIQELLADKLDWLDYSFGRSQRLVTTNQKTNFFYPAVHIGKGTYISTMPDQHLGNFSFFVIEDPQIFNKSLGTITVKFALVFWFNLDKIFPQSNDRNTEAIKDQILNTLTSKFQKPGRITLTKVMEQAENIYKGFSLKEVETQYLMQPFAGLRFEGELIVIQDEC